MVEEQSYSGTRDQFEFEESLAEVEVLEEILPMDFQVLKIGPFLKGETVAIPRWIAELLENYNMVTLKEKGELDIPQVMKALWKETDNPTLQEIDSFFYTKIHKRISTLKLKLSTETNPTLTRELAELEKARENIIDLRVAKIFKILARKTQRNEDLKRLSKEEATLYKRMVNNLKDWEEEQLDTGELEDGSRS